MARAVTAAGYDPISRGSLRCEVLVVLARTQRVLVDELEARASIRRFTWSRICTSLVTDEDAVAGQRQVMQDRPTTRPIGGRLLAVAIAPSRPDLAAVVVDVFRAPTVLLTVLVGWLIR